MSRPILSLLLLVSLATPAQARDALDSKTMTSGPYPTALPPLPPGEGRGEGTHPAPPPPPVRETSFKSALT
jgi:hypothetical protein